MGCVPLGGIIIEGRVTLSNSRAENTPVAMILSFPETPE